MSERTAKYRTEIQQMMFVSGETVEPSAETTTLVEQIVQEQVIEMLKQCTAQATRRGNRILNEDLMYLIRHNKPKLDRLRHFLKWKDVRKNVKESDDSGKDAGADIGNGDEALGAAMAGTAGPAVDIKKNKKARVELPWDVHSFFSEQVPARDDEEDEDEEEMNYATLERLKNADERTKDMSRKDYMHWSECRQASFTFRKSKRFREWAGFGVVTDAKPSDDFIDILGFLAFDIVQTLTEAALKVKAEEELGKEQNGQDSKGGILTKRKREPGLFDGPEKEREPVQTSHIQEAFRRLQEPSKRSRAMSHIVKRQPLQRALQLI